MQYQEQEIEENLDQYYEGEDENMEEPIDENEQDNQYVVHNNIEEIQDMGQFSNDFKITQKNYQNQQQQDYQGYSNSNGNENGYDYMSDKQEQLCLEFEELVEQAFQELNNGYVQEGLDKVEIAVYKMQDLSDQELFKDNFLDILKELNKEGLASMNQHDFYKAELIYLKAESLINNQDEQLFDSQNLKILNLNNIGCLYRRMGNIPRAIELLEEALNLVESSKNNQHAGLSHLNYSAVLSQIKDHHNCLEHSQKAIIFLQEYLQILCEGKTLDQLQGNEEFTELVQNLAMAYYNQGISQENLEQYEDCISSYDNAVKVACINLGEDHRLSQKLKTLHQNFLNKFQQIQRSLQRQQSREKKMQIQRQLSQKKRLSNQQVRQYAQRSNSNYSVKNSHQNSRMSNQSPTQYDSNIGKKRNSLQYRANPYLQSPKHSDQSSFIDQRDTSIQEIKKKELLNKYLPPSIPRPQKKENQINRENSLGQNKKYPVQQGNQVQSAKHIYQKQLSYNVAPHSLNRRPMSSKEKREGAIDRKNSQQQNQKNVNLSYQYHNYTEQNRQKTEDSLYQDYPNYQYRSQQNPNIQAPPYMKKFETPQEIIQQGNRDYIQDNSYYNPIKRPVLSQQRPQSAKSQQKKMDIQQKEIQKPQQSQQQPQQKKKLTNQSPRSFLLGGGATTDKSDIEDAQQYYQKKMAQIKSNNFMQQQHQIQDQDDILSWSDQNEDQEIFDPQIEANKKKFLMNMQHLKKKSLQQEKNIIYRDDNEIFSYEQNNDQNGIIVVGKNIVSSDKNTMFDIKYQKQQNTFQIDMDKDNMQICFFLFLDEKLVPFLSKGNQQFIRQASTNIKEIVNKMIQKGELVNGFLKFPNIIQGVRVINDQGQVKICNINKVQDDYFEIKLA